MESRPATLEEQKENMTALEEIKRLFPTLEDQDVGEFLVGATAYPFNSLVGCMPQIREMAKKTNGDWTKASLVACEEMDAEMARINSLTKEQHESWINSNLTLKEFSDANSLKLYD